MPDVSCSIDGTTVNVLPGTTVLAAAASAGVRIPALCNPEGLCGKSSCMVCLVRDESSDTMIPACSTPVYDGMRIDASSDVVREARKESLELLLSEHAGDCTAPCVRACPAGVDLERIMQLVREGFEDRAADELFLTLPLPETASWLCGGLCEKACRRKELTDRPVPFRALKKILSREGKPSPTAAPGGTRVLVLGAGAAGLSAAAVLGSYGVGVELAGREDGPGGELLEQPEEKLPRDVLSRELDRILSLPGVAYSAFRNPTDGSRSGRSDPFSGADAVLVTDASMLPDGAEASEPPDDPCAASRPEFFRLPSGRDGNAVKAIAMGRDAARRVLSYLARAGKAGILDGVPGTSVFPDRSDSRYGLRSPSSISALSKEQKSAYLEARPCPAGNPEKSDSPGSDPAADRTDAGRIAELCYGCGCDGASGCRLRELCAEHSVGTPGWPYSRPMATLSPFTIAGFVHESSKCILCGRCVREAEKADRGPGLSMFGRGLSTRLVVTDEGSIPEGFAEAVCSVCPTAALRPSGVSADGLPVPEVRR